MKWHLQKWKRPRKRLAVSYDSYDSIPENWVEMDQKFVSTLSICSIEIIFKYAGSRYFKKSYEL